MFSDVTKILDRNFVVGFFLPSLFFSFFLFWLLNDFGFLDAILVHIQFLPIASQEIAKDKNQLAELGVLSFVGSLLLMLCNRFIFRICEGYISIGGYSYLKGRELKRFKKAANSQGQRSQEKVFAEFPAEAFLLPTAFGNIIRAFETYPKESYGAEGICVWYRMLAVIPDDYRGSLDSDQSNVNFWLNTWFCSLVLAVLYFGLYVAKVFVQGIIPPLASACFPAFFLGSALLCAQGAKSAAREWGHNVRAAFDLFLPDLQEKLGFSTSLTKKHEYDLWVALSQVFQYKQAPFEGKERSWWDVVAEVEQQQAIAEEKAKSRYGAGSGKTKKKPKPKPEEPSFFQQLLGGVASVIKFLIGMASK